MVSKETNLFPGFSLGFGITLGWLGFLILLPITVLILSNLNISFADFIQLLTRPAAIAAFITTFKYSFYAAVINCFIGLLLAWVMARYNFFGKNFFDSIIDLPFALPGAVGGIALASVFGINGLIGSFFNEFDIKLIYNQFGILLGLIFVTLPFAVRSIQTLIYQLNPIQETAARMLGATPWQIFYRVQFPALIPGILSAFILTFARSIGEYGTVIFVAGNIPLQSEVISRYIYNKIDQYDMQGAIATASVLLLISFLILFLMSFVEKYFEQRYKKK